MYLEKEFLRSGLFFFSMVCIASLLKQFWMLFIMCLIVCVLIILKLKYFKERLKVSDKKF